MKEKLIVLISDAAVLCRYKEIMGENVTPAEIVADHLISNGVTVLPEGAIVLTRAEIEAMNTYSDKLRREHIKAAFDDAEELLQMAIKNECSKANRDDSHTHIYAKHLCQDLLEDMRRIERKLKE